MRRIDYDTYYRYLAYQRWLEEKRKRERRKKVIGVVLVMAVVFISVYLSFSDGYVPQTNQTASYGGLELPSSVEVSYKPDAHKFVAQFSVFYNVRPSSLVVTNCPYCKVEFLEKSAVFSCEFERFSDIPERLSVFDGINYYYVNLDKFAVADFKRGPGGEIFTYPSVVYKGDTITVKFSLVSDRLLANPRVIVVGVLKGYSFEYSYSPNTDGSFTYDFVVTLKGVEGSKYTLRVTAINLERPIESSITLNPVERRVTITPNFNEPVVILPGKSVVLSFTVTTNYDTTLNVVVQSDKNITASYVQNIPVLKGQMNDVTITLNANNVIDTTKGVVKVIISDEHVSKEFDVSVIVVPKIEISLLAINSSYTPEGYLKVELKLKSSARFDAVIDYVSSPKSVSPDFPMNTTIKAGVNTISFIVKGYPANTKAIDISLFADLYAYGVKVTTVEIDIRVNLS